MRVHQITATATYGDAITNDMLEIDRRLKAWGLDAYMYAGSIESRMSRRVRPDDAYRSFIKAPEDLLIYHYSIYSPNFELYEHSRNRRVVIYHNITPPEYFKGYDPGLESVCRLGRRTLSRLDGCDLAVGVSEYNRRELVSAGVPAERTGVLPIFLSWDKFEGVGRNAALYRRLTQSGNVNLLYVGRIVPNKVCEDLLKIVYVYHKYIDPQVRLWLVGFRFLTRYVKQLEALVERLNLQDVVTFTGRISLADLRTHYEAADAYIYASRHEGFGVPLLESMYFDVPILAYSAAAVPETLGPAGIMFKKMAYPEVAEMLHLLVTNMKLRRQVVQRQRQRLADFAPERVEGKLRAMLEGLGVL